MKLKALFSWIGIQEKNILFLFMSRVSGIQQENDLQVLRGWNRLAARAESIREFEMSM